MKANVERDVNLQPDFQDRIELLQIARRRKSFISKWPLQSLHNTPSTHPKGSVGRMMRSCFAGSSQHCFPYTVQIAHAAPPVVWLSQRHIWFSTSHGLLPCLVRGRLVRLSPSLSPSRVPRSYATTSDRRTYFKDFISLGKRATVVLDTQSVGDIFMGDYKWRSKELAVNA